MCQLMKICLAQYPCCSDSYNPQKSCLRFKNSLHPVLNKNSSLLSSLNIDFFNDNITNFLCGFTMLRKFAQGFSSLNLIYF